MTSSLTKRQKQNIPFEDKNIPFVGQKLSYRVETLHTGWRPLALQHILRFFENFENFGFCDHFSKKKDFLKFLGSKKQNFKPEIAIL